MSPDIYHLDTVPSIILITDIYKIILILITHGFIIITLSSKESYKYSSITIVKSMRVYLKKYIKVLLIVTTMY